MGSWLRKLILFVLRVPDLSNGNYIIINFQLASMLIIRCVLHFADQNKISDRTLILAHIWRLCLLIWVLPYTLLQRKDQMELIVFYIIAPIAYDDIFFLVLGNHS